MVSSISRKLRRYLLGATQKATRMWWIGQVTVRVMVVSRGNTTRPVREKAHHGAEKSRLTRRRKRGLRLSRGVDRVSADPPSNRQPLSKSQSSRKVNHMGRKHIWAQKASSNLRRDCEKYNKYPRGELSNPILQRTRLRCKMHCIAKWQRYRDNAVSAGIPLVTCFHNTFVDFLLTETSRAPPEAPMWGNAWDSLLAALPRRAPSPPGVYAFSEPVMAPRVKRHTRGGKEFTRQSNRACRKCGYFGPGPHAWNSCGPGLGRNSGVPTRRGRGKRRGVASSSPFS